MPAQQQFHEGGEEQQQTTRYDSATMQRVIETATRLQQAHRETVTAEQIEEIGREVGLDPQFVRQALNAVMAGHDVAIAPAVVGAKPAETRKVITARRSTVRAKRKIRPLTGTDILRACTPAFLYGIFAACAMSALHYGNSSGVEILLFFWQPLLLTLSIAWRTRRRRRAAITGAAFGFASMVGTVVGGGFSGRFDGGVFFGMLVLMLFLAIVGAGAAGVSAWRRRFRVISREEEQAHLSPAAE